MNALLHLKFDAAVAPMKARYQGLARRERALLLATAIAAVGGVWDQAVLEPQAVAGTALASQIDGLRLRLRQEQQIAAGLAESDNQSRIARLRHERADALGLQSAQQAQLAQALAGFVAPAQVGRLLADVLKRHPGLQMIKAESLPPEPLLAQAEAAGPSARVDGSGATQARATSAVSAPGPQLYRHGLALELRGSYLEAYAYLRELETLPWGLRWDRVSFEVTEHPAGRLVLRLHTLSKGPEWIGV